MSKTPMMRQYEEAKNVAPDALLLFRMGDFYELFFEDAKTAARVLGLTLTSRDKNGDDPIAMAGFPHHQLDSYLARLIRAGFRVAVCEQVEDPKTAKGLVKRQVTQVVSPGTVTDHELLDPTRLNNLAALVAPQSPESTVWGLSWVELTNGEFVAFCGSEVQVRDILERLNASEILVTSSTSERMPVLGYQPSITPRPDWTFAPRHAVDRLTKHYRVATLEGFGFDQADVPAVQAAAALLLYVEEAQPAAAQALTRLTRFQPGHSVEIDQASWRSLEITRTIRSDSREGSLLGTIDRCVTPMGSRVLAHWLTVPLNKLDDVNQRLDAVAELVAANRLREALREALRPIVDLERIIARVVNGRATPRDLRHVANSLARVPTIRSQLETCHAGLLKRLVLELDPCDELRDHLDAALGDDAPLAVNQGGFVRPGFSPELDRLRNLATGGKRWIAEYQSKVIQETGIPTLKVGFNKVFGYYIEVTHAQQTKVPDYFIRKQTLKNGERYITPELKEYEEQVLTADEQAIALEIQILDDLRARAHGHATRLKTGARQLACLDVLLGLAHLAHSQRYCRPEITSDQVVVIEDGRHPVLDVIQPLGAFVPNDTKLDDEAGTIHLITGPNMAGKSTYIRQVALITLMAQIGSFVPARRARIGLVDRIFARVGASDELSRGQSTFMVEMTETARILNTATKSSLVILDEIGRGTSTYDGVSLAWAIVEYLHDRIGCRTLFATHYHELTELEQTFPSVRNFNVSVREWEDRIVFLHKIVRGGADKSYGIHVARLAGVPEWVSARAEEILASLQSHHHREPVEIGLAARTAKPQVQLTLFEMADHPLLDRIQRIDTDHVTPIGALKMLHDWKRELEDEKKGREADR